MGEVKVFKGGQSEQDPGTCPRCGMPVLEPRTEEGLRFVERCKKWLREFRDEMELKGL